MLSQAHVRCSAVLEKNPLKQKNDVTIVY